MPLNRYQITETEVQKEFFLGTDRFNYMACWVGIILNLVWFASDYFVIPEYWLPFLIFRLKVSGITLLCLLFRKRLKIRIHICLFILVLGLTVQNAYMWSVMDLEHFQKHTLAYIVMYIGMGMLVLWKDVFSWVIMIVFVLSNAIYYPLKSKLTLDEFLVSGGLLVFTVALFSVFMVRNRYRLTLREIKSRLALEKSNEQLEETNKEITDSINYSKRIQQALLKQDDFFKVHFKDHFVFFQPKDIVSGDFYWITKLNKLQAEKGKKFATVPSDLIYIAAADSTGHGVPGAFMSLLNMAFLSEAINERQISKPNEVFNYVREKLINTVSADGGKDGMDAILLCVNTTLNIVTYCAANNLPVLIRNNEFIDLQKDKMPIGKGEKTDSFTLREIDVQPGDVIYMYTDGYADQFGGENGKKFKYKPLNELLLKIHQLPMQEQKQILHDKFISWKGNLEQVDDVCMIAIRF